MLEFFSFIFVEKTSSQKKKKNNVDDILQLKRESNFIHFSFINSDSNYPVDLHPEKKQKHIVFIFLFLLFQMKIKRYKFVTIL